MLMKTHLAIAAAAALLLIGAVNNKIAFFMVVMVVTLIPDIDISNSYLGKKWYFRPLQFFVKHRGIIHSLTLCVVLAFIISLILPSLALPFYVGYGVHLFLDSLTVEGVRPFWPLKGQIGGKIRVGGRVEDTIFVVFLIIDFILLIRLFF